MRRGCPGVLEPARATLTARRAQRRWTGMCTVAGANRMHRTKLQILIPSKGKITMNKQLHRASFTFALTLGCGLCLALLAAPVSANPPIKELDAQLATVLQAAGFTGRIQEQLPKRLGRPLSPPLADAGRALWFDTISGLKNDNTCAGCHSPTNGFGDTQPIAIGIENNGMVGPKRAGPRNMRRTPMIMNNAFYPALMWNGRFSARSGNPFDNRAGFLFPAPEGLTLSYLPHLLTAQAFIPPTERNEMAGFEFPGDNNAIRFEVLRRLNTTPNYRLIFGNLFPSVAFGGPITFDMYGLAISEFEFSLALADAPLDKFARGQAQAMSDDETRRTAFLRQGWLRFVPCGRRHVQ